MNKKKFLSLIMALVMLVGVFSPLTALAAEGDTTEGKEDTKVAAPVGTDLKTSKTLPTETTVNVYKLEAESYNSPRQWDHNGGKLSTEQLNTLGKNVKPLKGVEFSYYTVTAAQLEKLKAAKPAPATAEEVKTTLGQDFTQEAKKLTKTDAEGKATVNLKNGNYWFIETETPANVTTNGAHAIPFALTLPQVKLVKNDAGNFEAADPVEYLTELNIYPKNTTTTPKIDKDFEKQANPEKPRTEDDKNKNKREYTLGDDVPYEIKTVIPAHTEYKSVYWSDQMTEGLTFKEDTLEVKIGETKLTKDTDYKLTKEGNGFKLVLEASGLEKIKNKDKDVTITVTYKAELNEKSVVNIPESNDVTFHYGNKPTEGNTPVPNKPNDDKKITVTKTMTGVKWPKDGIKVQLYNANTGAKVGDVQTLTSDNPSYTWENLDLRYEYKVVELTTGYDVIYGKGETAGTLSIENKETEEPEPLKPHEPKVVHYGKKFVKADKGTNKSLEGAKFVVKNVSFSNNDDNHLESAKDKYLALKDAKQTNADRVAYLNARAEYEKMIAEANVDQIAADKFYKETVKPAYEALKTKYVWKDATVTAATGEADFNNTDNLVVLESDKAGRFAIDGLPAGTYELVEVKAPAGYALPTNNFEFTVDENSFNNEKDGVVYEKDDKEVTVTDGGTAKRINNSNLTIPQTGGMGTVLFTIVGISLMAGAVVAMKRNREEA